MSKFYIFIGALLPVLSALSAAEEPRATTPSTEFEYYLEPGDLVSITVFGEPDLSIPSIRIPVSGNISYPLVGEINLIGKTVRSIELNLSHKLASGYLRNPTVSVSVLEYRPIFVRGAVNAAGQHPFSIGMTIEKVIAVAGGFSEDADVSKITFIRKTASGNQSQEAELGSPVSPGDIIDVAKSDIVSKSATSYIYMYGEVSKPGSYEFRNGLSVEKAIALAGGFGIRASKKKINISREGNPPVKIKRAQLTDKIMPGDVITVGASLF